MSVRMALLLPFIFSLMIHRVSSADRGVNYRPSHICALKHSSVTFYCTYTYPTRYKIKKVFWTKTLDKDGSKESSEEGEQHKDLSEDPEYSQRLQYLGDKQKNCTIRLSHVTQKDEHMYYFRFITDKPDLQVESPETVTEGDSVRLTCKSSCALTDRATFIWYRNSQPLTERRDRNNQLLLQSVRREDAGRYSCGVQGHTYISPAVQLNVTYPLKSVSVSISPSGEIVEGDSVTLSCSSDSNPPAEMSWFKGRMFLGSGRNYNISKISSDHSGEYKCKSRNKHGEKYSEAVTLNIMYAPRNVSVFINGSGETVEGDSVTLICSSDSNPPALNFSWFKENQISSVGSGQSFSALQSGRFYCEAHNQHGSQRSDAVTVNVMYPPKNVSVSISPSGEIVEGDSVTLICSSDSNPPAEINWFKGITFVGSGRIYNISKISSDHSGEYKCKSSNEHGEKYSDAVTLNVMYAPRNVSVFINGSGEIVEGDSVTLICSSDSNPPALNFSWFQENQISSVGSGQSFSALQSGRFCCEAHNQHGSQRSDAVTVTVKDKTVLYAAVVIAAGCGVLFLICIIMFMFIRKRKSGYDIRQKQVQQPPSSETNYSDDGLYARISSKRPSADHTIGKTIKTVYTMIQHVKNIESNGNLTVHPPDPAVG